MTRPRGGLTQGTRKGGAVFFYASPGPQVVSPAQCTVSVIGGGSTVVSGASKTLRLQLKDAAGANVTTSTGLAIIPTKADGSSTGTLSSITDNGDGTIDWTYAGILAGTAQTLGATVNGVSVGNATSLSVIPGAIDRTTSTVTVAIATATVGGSTVTATLQAKDAAGNNLTAGGSTVVINNSGGTSAGTWSATTDVGNGTYTRAFTATGLGTATTLTATIAGQSVTTSMPTITVSGATDTFTRADGALGGDWSPQSGLGTPTIKNNAVGCRQFHATTYIAQAFNADCSSEVTLAPGYSNADMKKTIQVFARRDPNTLARYGLHSVPNSVPGENAGLHLKYDGVASTVILAETTKVAPAAGDVWKITVVGSLITGYINGIQMLQVTDTRITAAGGLGFGWVTNVGTAADDEIVGDWTGRNL